MPFAVPLAKYGKVPPPPAVLSQESTIPASDKDVARPKRENTHIYFDDDGNIETVLEPRRAVRKRKRRAKAAAAAAEEASGIIDDVRGPQRADPTKEKRVGRFRRNENRNFLDLLERATNHRMYVLKREHTGTEADPEQTITIAGRTGNVYTVKIGRSPECNCPYVINSGRRCKHIVFVLAKVLKARRYLWRQVAFLGEELNEMFAGAPPILNENLSNGGIRKPVEGDCPICCCEYSGDESITFCKACGNNIHKDCLQHWSESAVARRAGVKCPYCREPWPAEDRISVVLNRTRGMVTEGYVNVANELGISTVADTSTYNGSDN